ncbi:MAG: hypothetical protein ACKOEW_10580 [Methylocystis sp.]
MVEAAGQLSAALTYKNRELLRFFKKFEPRLDKAIPALSIQKYCLNPRYNLAYILD